MASADLRAERQQRRERETEENAEEHDYVNHVLLHISKRLHAVNPLYVLYVYLRFGEAQSVQEQSQSKEEPNLHSLGKLTAEINTYKVGVVDGNTNQWVEEIK